METTHQDESPIELSSQSSGCGSRLMLFPLVWFVVLVWSGIGADRVRFTLRDAWFLAVGTLVAIGILAYDIRRERGCAAKSLPALLLFFFVMNLFVLWVWNV